MKPFLLTINLILEHWPNRAHFHFCWLILTTDWRKQQSYIKDTTHFINFNKNILLPEEAIWVLLTFVLSTLTFPKRRELISSANIMKSIIVKISHHNKILGDLKRLLPKKNFFNDKDKHYLETLGIAIGTKKMVIDRGHVHGSYWETGTSYVHTSPPKLFL